jgi:hypothetical protein
MLTATLAGFMALAKLLQALRSGRFTLPWQNRPVGHSAATRTRLAVEQSCMVDGKRRLLLVRCDNQLVLLLTGGPADLVVSVLPSPGSVA